MRSPGPQVVLLALLLFGAGCSIECQQLCRDWYDYRLGTCGEVNLDDERVGCISDFVDRLVTEDELKECAERSAQIEAMASDDASCCPGQATADCPWLEPDPLPAR